MPDLLRKWAQQMTVRPIPDIVFAEDVELVRGQPVVPVIKQLGTKVLSIVDAIEAKCRQAGYFS
jgi:hypothetical protein